MCPIANIFILILISIAVCTGINQPQFDINDELGELLIDILDPSLVDTMNTENDVEIQELSDEHHPKDLHKLLEMYSDKILEIEEINGNEPEMVNNEQNISKESKHPKNVSPIETIADQDLIPDKNEIQKLLSMLNLDVLEDLLALEDAGNDQETLPNFQMVLDASVFVRGALRNIFESLLTSPEKLLDTPVAELEKPDIKTILRLSKTPTTLEAMAELQASNVVQKALAELQVSNIVQQALAGLQSSKAVQNALTEFQNSNVIQQLTAELKATNAAKKRLVEGLSKIQMIMTEASKSVQKAIEEDPKALSKFMAGLQASLPTSVQEILAGLQGSNDAQETMEQMQTSDDVQESMEELMALNAMEGAIAEAQDAAAYQKTMTLEDAASNLKDFLSKAQAELAPQGDMEELQNLEASSVTMDKTETEATFEEATVEFQDSSTTEEAHIDDTEGLGDTE